MKELKNKMKVCIFTSLDTEGVILEKAEIKWLCLTTVFISGGGLLLALLTC